MKLFNSIRWRLQIWYGLVLVVVLAGFGFTAYQLEHGRQLRRIDEDLQRRAAAVANALRPRPMRGLGQGGPERIPGEPMPPRGQGQRRFGGPPDDDGPDRLPPVDEIGARLQQTGLFDESDATGFYYIVWSRDGRELLRSTNAPAVSTYPRAVARFTAARTRSDVSATNPPPFEPHPPEMRENFRELPVRVSRGAVAVVGRSIEPELDELRRTGWKLTGVGAAVLLLGLAGGWWIAARAMRPIEHISGTAAKISASDLSQRINVAETDSELGHLASVLNSTFARLDAAFTQQRQFTSDAAHELRTPVSVMLTQAQTALNRERSPAEYRETVEACQRAAQRMRRLIESLLELARLDAGQEQMKRMRFDLAQAVRECVEQIRPLADARGIAVTEELPPIDIEGDRERLAQVLTNLLSNAIQYNKDNGEVRVQLKKEPNAVVLTVNDSGPGISADDLPRVFERFYRADKARSSSHTGLGLAICKAIVTAHGGTIEADSREGEGTIVTVRLSA